MIKTEDREIKVISKMNKEGLEQAKKLFIFVLIIMILLSIYGFVFINVTFGIVGLVLFLCDLGLILLCKKLILNAGKEKLFLTLNKDELIVQEKKICNTEEITNFACDNSANSTNLNEVFINYTTDKKHTKTIMLRGARNRDFINIANNYIQDLKNGNIDNFNQKTYTEENNEEKIFDLQLLKDGKTVEAFFIGKTKDFEKNGNITNLKYMQPTLIFMTKDGEIANFDSRLAENLEIEDLKDNKYYNISYNKKERKFVFVKNNDVEFNEKIIEKYKGYYKNHVEILFTDNPEIWTEMELENKIEKYSNEIKIFAYLGTVISLCIGIFGYWFKNVDAYVLVNILKVWIVFIIIMSLINAGTIAAITSKYKKSKLKY